MENENKGFFEAILFKNGKMPLWKFHYNRIKKSWPFFFPYKSLPSSEMLHQLIFEQIENFNDSKKIKLIFLNEKIDIQISDFSIEQNKIKKTKKLIIYKEEKLELNKPNFKSIERKIYNNSLSYALHNGADQSIILDKNDNIIETSIANIFFIYNNEIHTPFLKSGCVEGVYRTYLKERIQRTKKWVWIEKNIPYSEVSNYTKIFISNALRGINIAKII